MWEALKSNPKQREALESGNEGWISHRDLTAFYLTQETSQLMRSARGGHLNFAKGVSSKVGGVEILGGSGGPTEYFWPSKYF